FHFNITRCCSKSRVKMTCPFIGVCRRWAQSPFLVGLPLSNMLAAGELLLKPPTSYGQRRSHHVLWKLVGLLFRCSRTLKRTFRSWKRKTLFLRAMRIQSSFPYAQSYAASNCDAQDVLVSALLVGRQRL